VFSFLCIAVPCIYGYRQYRVAVVTEESRAYQKHRPFPLPETSGETFAAIAACTDCMPTRIEVHDVKSTILTIERSGGIILTGIQDTISEKIA
jgi:hypothetical protein